VTYLGEGYAGALAFALAFAFSTKDRAFYILLCHATGSTMNKNLKIIYRNPRPYMVDSEIIAFECSKSFGNPSGHSTLSACLYVTLFLLCFHDGQYTSIHRPTSLNEPLLRNTNTYSKAKKRRSDWLDWVIYLLALALTLLIIFTVGLSRVLLGVHSMNQVVYGWSYGAYVALFLFKFVRPRLREHIYELPYHREYLSYYLFRALLIWLVVIVFSFFNWIVAKRDFVVPPPQLWLDNLMAKCQMIFNESRMFVAPAFIKMGLVSSPLGAYMGLLLDARLFNGTEVHSLFQPHVQYKPARPLYYDGVGRLVVGFTLSSPLLLPYFYMKDDYTVLTQYICRTSVPFFLIFFWLFGFSKEVFPRFGLQPEAKQ
jgi:membrane-associated phospholipid phosphatase